MKEKKNRIPKSNKEILAESQAKRIKDISYQKDIVKTITPLGAGGTAEYFIRELGLDMDVED